MKFTVRLLALLLVAATAFTLVGKRGVIATNDLHFCRVTNGIVVKTEHLQLAGGIGLDGDLGLVEIQGGLVVLGDDQSFHSGLSVGHRIHRARQSIKVGSKLFII